MLAVNIKFWVFNGVSVGETPTDREKQYKFKDVELTQLQLTFTLESTSVPIFDKAVMILIIVTLIYFFISMHYNY